MVQQDISDNFLFNSVFHFYILPTIHAIIFTINLLNLFKFKWTYTYIHLFE